MLGVYINYIRVCLACILNESNEKKSGETDRDRKYNKIQACFVLETFYSEFSPLRALSRPRKGQSTKRS